MKAECIDEKLLTMLKYLLITSQLRTSLSIQLADYAAQLMGYRSTCQTNDKDEVEKTYINLINTLIYITYRCIDYINDEHSYQDNVMGMNEHELEILLETTLFESTIYSDYRIFKEKFFI